MAIAPTVDPGFASWLMSQSLKTAADSADIAAAWGDRSATTEYLSPLALLSDAQVEAARQLGFLSGPLAFDEHVVPGLRHDLIGKSIRLVGTGLGYEAPGAVVFVIRVQESDETDMTSITVLRRLS